MEEEFVVECFVCKKEFDPKEEHCAIEFMREILVDDNEIEVIESLDTLWICPKCCKRIKTIKDIAGFLSKVTDIVPKPSIFKRVFRK